MDGDKEAQTLTWSVRLWQKEPRKLMIVAAVAFIAAALGLWLIRSPLGGVLGFALIGGATADFWMPVHFSLDGTKATRRCGLSFTSIEWSEVKRADVMEHGVKLSPLPSGESRMEPFRGVFLIFQNNAEQVLAAIRSQGGKDV